MKFETVDYISVITLAGCIVLLVLGRDSFVAATITAIIGYYYGHKRKAENSARKR